MTNPEAPVTSRRSFLYGATAAMGTVGLAAAAWPFIDQMNPDANVRATDDAVELYLVNLPPGQQRIVRWQHMPIFVVRRTTDMLKAMQKPAFVRLLLDPQSRQRQQPDYARNWHRSIDPAYAVLAGVCTYCACVPVYRADAAADAEPAGGYVCPCCASHFDPAGRAYRGIAQFNLPVPPHVIIDRDRLVVGRNPPGEIFSFQSIERV